MIASNFCDKNKKQLRIALYGDFYCPVVWGDARIVFQSADHFRRVESIPTIIEHVCQPGVESPAEDSRKLLNKNGNDAGIGKVKMSQEEEALSNSTVMKDTSTGMSQPLLVDVAVGNSQIELIEIGTGYSPPPLSSFESGTQVSQEFEVKETSMKSTKRPYATDLKNPIISPRLPLQTIAPEVLPKIPKMSYLEDCGKSHPLYSYASSSITAYELDFDETNKENSFVVLDQQKATKRIITSGRIYDETMTPTKQINDQNENYGPLPSWNTHCFSRNPFVRVGLSKKSVARKRNPLHPVRVKPPKSDIDAENELSD